MCTNTVLYPNNLNTNTAFVVSICHKRSRFFGCTKCWQIVAQSIMQKELQVLMLLTAFSINFQYLYFSYIIGRQLFAFNFQVWAYYTRKLTLNSHLFVSDRDKAYADLDVTAKLSSGSFRVIALIPYLVKTHSPSHCCSVLLDLCM